MTSRTIAPDGAPAEREALGAATDAPPARSRDQEALTPRQVFTDRGRHAGTQHLDRLHELRMRE
jgi:hypothetical protein